jgi:hypothetical protein
MLDATQNIYIYIGIETEGPPNIYILLVYYFYSTPQ